MRSLFIASLVSLASAYRDWNGIDTKWATHPDKTAQWYEEHVNGRLPELAPTITTVVANKSSIVKLECVGCPFRVRKLHPEPEEWQEQQQDNSMLLNFTIDASSPSLLLNGQPIAPLSSMPLHINAFQVNSNFSKEYMDKAASLQMMDESWNLGIKYGIFQLQYEHTIVGTHEFGKRWIQFDITGIIYPSEAHSLNGHYELRAEDQKMVQILLRETNEPHALAMEEVQVVDRKDRVKPFLMKCGRPAMAKTVFNSLEWDYYGKVGTWSRSFSVLLSSAADAFWRSLPFIPITIVLIILARWIAKKQQLEVDTLAEDDVEAVLLVEGHEDAPPEYEDEPKGSLTEEKA